MKFEFWKKLDEPILSIFLSLKEVCENSHVGAGLKTLLDDLMKFSI